MLGAMLLLVLTWRWGVDASMALLYSCTCPLLGSHCHAPNAVIDMEAGATNARFQHFTLGYPILTSNPLHRRLEVAQA
ncbi:unnamed protein product [Urochloa humidicola]